MIDMKLTKQQRDELAAKLNHPYGSARLKCDGRRIDLQVQRFGKGVSYRVMTFVDGEWKGTWMSAKTEHPEQKFMRKSVRPNLSPTKRKEAEKVFGKRRVANDPFWSGSVTIYCPDWSSGKAAISHLCKVCESVEIWPEDQP